MARLSRRGSSYRPCRAFGKAISDSIRKSPQTSAGRKRLRTTRQEYQKGHTKMTTVRNYQNAHPNQPALGTRRPLPSPFRQGRPLGSFANHTYSKHPSVDEVPRLLASSLAQGIRVDGASHYVYRLRGTFLVERDRVRGPLVRCNCGRRCVQLYFRDGSWTCRLCARLRYPSQRLSAKKRRLASEFRKLLGPRTLQSSKDAILHIELRRVGIILPIQETRSPASPFQRNGSPR